VFALMLVIALIVPLGTAGVYLKIGMPFATLNVPTQAQSRHGHQQGARRAARASG
jgi:hypothetical protein